MIAFTAIYITAADPFLHAVEYFQKELCQSKSLLLLANKFQNEYSVHYTVSSVDPTAEAKKVFASVKKSMHASCSIEELEGETLTL